MVDARKPISNEENRAERRLLAELAARQRQRNSVAQAIEQLSICARVPEEDRPLMAKELGRLAKQQFGEEYKQKLPEVFQEAFGSTWDSLYKKRKRFMRFANETDEGAKAEPLNAHGRKFLRLAHAIADLSAGVSSPAEDLRHRAEACLIAGTSFDGDSGRDVRKQDERRDRFAKYMLKLETKVLNSVDLKSYRDLAREHPVVALTKRKHAEEVSLSFKAADSWEGEASQLDLSASALGNLPTGIVPRVELGKLWVKWSNSYPCKEVGVSEEEICRIGEKDALKRTMVSTIEGIEPSRQDVLTIAEEHRFSEIAPDEYLESKRSCDDSVRLIDHHNQMSIWIQFRVFLELRFNAIENSFKLCIGHYDRSDKSSEGAFAMVDSIPFKHTPEDKSLYNMWGCWPYKRIDKAREEKSKTTRYLISFAGLFLFEQDAYLEQDLSQLESLFCPVNGLQMGVVAFPLPASLRYAVEPVENCNARWYPCIAEAEGYVKDFSPGSFGHAILSNLAHAPRAKRIDQLLIADAKAKLEALEAFRAEQRRAFDRKLNWLRDDM